MTGRTCEHVHEYVWEQRWRRDPRELARLAAVDRELSLVRLEHARLSARLGSVAAGWIGARLVQLGGHVMHLGAALDAQPLNEAREHPNVM